MKSKQAIASLVLMLIVASFLLGCRPSLEPPVSESIQIPTATVLESSGSSEGSTEFENTFTPTPEQLNQPVEDLRPTVSADDATGKSDEVDSQERPTNESIVEQELLYRVVFVEENDHLNVREGPGVSFSKVGELKPASTGILVTDTGELVEHSLWVPIETTELEGWVNSRYLTLDLPSAAFCADDDAEEFVAKVHSALTNEDGNLLAEMIPDNRVLRIRRHWWNTEVVLEHKDAEKIFDNDELMTWGTADGSGSLIEGSFADVISPLIERNLTSDNILDCNNFGHGGTAGIIGLPASYQGINYFSSHRPPGPEDFELDWGTWVVGVEKWQGRYILSYLIHYEWEI